MTIEGIPKEMKAVQVVEFNKPYKIHQVPTPTQLKDYEVLLKTVVASLCHTDSMVTAGKFPTKLPCTASHEGTGIVKAVGSKVNNFKVGDRVMSGLPRNPCGICYNCKSDDWHQYCEDIEGHIGIIVDGAFAEYHVVDSRSSCHIPDNVSFTSAAPLACAGSTIYRSIIVSKVKEGGWLAIVGAGGGLGHLGIQFAQAKGINVVAIDARDEGLELCKKAGAEHIFDAREGSENVVQKVQDLTGGLGVHAAINGERARKLGRSCLSGHKNAWVHDPGGATRTGSLIADKDDSQQMLDDVSKYNIKVETNLFYGLDELPKMVELAHSGKMRGKAICVIDDDELKKEKAS